jgi:hypothetical protein
VQKHWQTQFLGEKIIDLTICLNPDANNFTFTYFYGQKTNTVSQHGYKWLNVTSRRIKCSYFQDGSTQILITMGTDEVNDFYHVT